MNTPQEYLMQMLGAAKEDVIEAEIAHLTPYPEQPFKPYIGDKLNQLAESIRQNGVLTPLIVQKTDEETYRIISGHNRVAAAKLIELYSVPCIVKKIADAEAEIILTETNLMSHAEILPSEKAFICAHNAVLF